MTKTVLLITAHPDDHVCAAGTLLMLRGKGFKIHEIVATAGEKSVWRESGTQRLRRNIDQAALAATRRKELLYASQMLGISSTSFLDFPDSEVQRSYAHIRQIIAIIRKVKPSLIFTMSPRDLHHDHRKIAKITVEAAERASWEGDPDLGRSWRAQGVLFTEGLWVGRAHLVVDITPYWRKKQKILESYGSQIDMRERSLFEAINTYHGYFRQDKNIKYAEAFEIPEQFPLAWHGSML